MVNLGMGWGNEGGEISSLRRKLVETFSPRHLSSANI
jgi:hypothetical protein